MGNKSRYGLPPNPWVGKVVKGIAREVVKTSEIYLNKSPKSLSILDVGSGHGEYSAEMAKYFRHVTAVEPLKDVYKTAVRTNSNVRNLRFFNTKIENFKSKSKYDLITAFTVFEHMSTPFEAFKQIFSLLGKDGIIYLTAPNKYWFFEQHYGLPFLSWLPLPLANKYLELTKGSKSYEDCSYSRGYDGMKRFFNQFNCRYEFILPFDEDTAYIGCGKNQLGFNLIKKIGIRLIRLHPFFWNFSKGFIIVVRKK